LNSLIETETKARQPEPGGLIIREEGWVKSALYSLKNGVLRRDNGEGCTLLYIIYIIYPFTHQRYRVGSRIK
jgi:hypothetical protein